MTPLYEQARDRTEQLRDAITRELEGDDPRAVEGLIAGGIEVWQSDHGGIMVEMMIGGGGPSDGVTVRNGHATYWTTDTDDHRTQRFSMGPDDAEEWAAYAGMFER